MYELTAIFISLFLWAIVMAIYSAYTVDDITDILYPDGSTYVWGYFVGFVGVYGAIMGILSIPILYWYGYITTVMAELMLLYFSLIWITHRQILRRKRWAWVVGVVLHMNILSWIVNYNYVRTRWNYINQHKYVNNTFKGKKKVRKFHK